MAQSQPRRLLTSVVAVMSGFGLLVGGFTIAGAPAVADSVWTAPVDLSGSSVNLPDPQLATSTDGQTVTVSWLLSSGPDTGYRLQTRTSRDGGRTWGATRELTDVSDEAFAGTRLLMSDDGSRIMAVWSRYDPDAKEQVVTVRSSSDSGASWGTPVEIGSGSWPVAMMSADGSQVTVAWAGADEVVRSRSSSDSGQNWLAPVDVAGPFDWAQGLQMSASEDGQTLNLLWAPYVSGSASYLMMVSTSRDAGASWSAAQTLSTPGSQASYAISVTSDDGSRAAAVWKQLDLEDTLVSSSTSDAGATWRPVTVVASSPNALGGSSLSASSDINQLVLAATVYGSTGEVHIARSSDSGVTWSATQRISDPKFRTTSGSVVMSADGTKAATVMVQEGGGAGAGRSEVSNVLLRTSVDSGASWGTAKRIGSGQADSAQLVASENLSAMTSIWNDGSSPVKVRAASQYSSAPTPTPTKPTPTPTPTPVKKQQEPTLRAKLPKRLVKKGKTVLAPARPLTTAGQLLQTRVRCLPPRAGTAGEVRFCGVRRFKNGKVTVRMPGPPLPRVIVVQIAPATETYDPYRKRTVYKRGRR